MSHVTYSLHSVFDKHDWDFEEMNKFLKEGSFSVNEINICLLRVLKNNEKCSVEIVKLLLQYGACVNCSNRSSVTPLATALLHSRNESIVKLLLEKGANVNVLVRKKSLICIALYSSASKNVVKVLLDAGCPLSACKVHGSALCCAINLPKVGSKENVLELLIEAGTDVNEVDEEGRSLLCFALELCAAHDIELLLKAGSSLFVCKKHKAPLVCVYSLILGKGVSENAFKGDVVKLLYDLDDCNRECGFYQNILQLAIYRSKYKTEEIKLLLDCLGIDINVKDPDKCNLLHLAVSNPYCKPSLVKLLIDRKIKINKLNAFMETPLHRAVQNRNCQPSVIETLLKNGSLINACGDHGKTPLRIALDSGQKCNILKILLQGGAWVGLTKYRGYSLLECVGNNYEVEEKPDCVKILVKYAFLESPDHDIKTLLRGYKDNKIFWDFAIKCNRELQKMQFISIGHGCTLHGFLSNYSTGIVAQDYKSESKYDFNELLSIRACNTFPIYFDIISSKAGKLLREIELPKIQVYVVKHSTDSSCTEKINLNYLSVYKIAQYLSNDDLLRFILAFYNVNDPHYNGHERCVVEENRLEGTRSSENFVQFHKRPKL